MTAQEASDKLRKIIEGREDPRGKCDTDYALEMAISSLEKQIPKEPKYDDDGERYRCPSCNHGVYYDDVCPSCGQYISWYFK